MVDSLEALLVVRIEYGAYSYSKHIVSEKVYKRTSFRAIYYCNPYHLILTTF